ncbi:DUF1462 family protein [Halalkalibacterium halodurans]|uniref:BH3416 protein n=1 Tax=Halalkalibacterium halodurans (strain ATCC BAA-125 / DSM 18197 / FERM 7344 / JCM 9153 / C-125) TaxID=272558 RepID=Q9K7E6_HALH5|nr:DUF1462 family protein [Halalkalibacterium halodurans]MED4174136.1 DUF1462 family protein [Halalkalibacterium halodurans]BAB07135.1 BH3416 [Halalkalibacterium halodurans C-125]
MGQLIEVTVFGAEEKCASCIHLPSAKETMEWLEAAVKRKYPEHNFRFRYVDINKVAEKKDQAYADAILSDEYMYPLVVIEDEVVAEGNPRLKDVYVKIDAM